MSRLTPDSSPVVSLEKGEKREGSSRFSPFSRETTGNESGLTLLNMQLRVYEAFSVTTCQFSQKWCALLKYKWVETPVNLRSGSFFFFFFFLRADEARDIKG